MIKNSLCLHGLVFLALNPYFISHRLFLEGLDDEWNTYIVLMNHKPCIGQCIIPYLHCIDGAEDKPEIEGLMNTLQLALYLVCTSFV